MSLSRDQYVRLCTLGIPLLLILLISALLQFANVFPTHISPFYKNDPSLSFPSVPETLSGPVLLLICLVVPILCIVVPTLPTPPSDGFLYSLPCIGNFLTYIFSGTLKCMTGELRPSFLALCQVNESMELDGNYVNSTMSAVICTGKDALDGRHSFPSSHCSQVCSLQWRDVMFHYLFYWCDHFCHTNYRFLLISSVSIIHIMFIWSAPLPKL